MRRCFYCDYKISVIDVFNTHDAVSHYENACKTCYNVLKMIEQKKTKTDVKKHGDFVRAWIKKRDKILKEG